MKLVVGYDGELDDPKLEGNEARPCIREHRSYHVPVNIMAVIVGSFRSLADRPAAGGHGRLRIALGAGCSGRWCL